MADIPSRNMGSIINESDLILELSNCGLFTDDEINIISKKLADNRFRLSSSTSRLQDFGDSIEYLEKVLLDEIPKRTRGTRSINTGRLKSAIIQMLQYYYEYALKSYSSDLNFCLEYLNFLGSHSSLDNGAKHISEMIERFKSEPKVFEKAAAWYKQKDCHMEAIKVLLKGIGTHPSEKFLYIYLIDVELSNPQDNKIPRFKKYIDSILKNIPDPDCFEILMYVLTLFETHLRLYPVQDYILDLLLQKYPDEERVWHTIAIRELNGHYYNASPEEMRKQSTKHSIRRCIARYKEGIAKVPGKKKPALWKLYLDTLIDLQKDNPRVANVFKVNSLREALEEAKMMKIPMEELHWKALVDICAGNDELVMEILVEATRCRPSSVQLWLLYLKFCLLRNNFNKAEVVFERAITSLGHRAVPVWDLYITTQQLYSDVKTEELFKRATAEPYEEIAREFKPRYLRWSAMFNPDPKYFRNVYWELALKPPFTRELHREMLTLERIDGRDHFKQQFAVFKLYSEQFGDDIDVWLDWIGTIWEQNKPDQDAEATKVYENAVEKLPQIKIQEFIEKYRERDIDKMVKKLPS
ncbi:uncharacterized protein LOC115889896 [Sitophilus oryzae]|uniref:Uncharacterized protein LOC115889896 n=1 Tax=Sitophilus oryzae TaxID=7048 RepID=A0A6J2YRA9_SITOR|nr:uncharacterized protein LOC115889896 [Sitophilus oryzae]